MAFFSKVGNILRQTASKQISAESSTARPSIFQAIRCMSSSKLFVGGISYATDDQSLREAFGKYGEVVEARVIMDRESGRSRGFGFVTYTSSEEASTAIQALDGQDLYGRRIRVNYANERPRNFGSPPGQYGGGGGYGVGAGGYGGGYGANAGYGGGSYGGGGASQGTGGNYGGNFGGENYGGNNFGYAGPGNADGGGSFSVAGGSDNYASSGGNYGGNYGGAPAYDNGNTGALGSSSGNFGISGGSGGSNEFVASNPGGGYDGSSGLGFGGDDQLGSNTGGMGDPADGCNPDDSAEQGFRDDEDDSSDFAKRA